MVFPFVAGFLDRCDGVSERPMLITVYTFHSDLLHKVYAGLQRSSGLNLSPEL